MAQILDPLPSDNENQHILCCYVNATSHIQIARITNIPNWYFERVVFPGQRLVFQALGKAQLEIHSGMMASAILSDTIPCDRLRVDEDDNALEPPIAKPFVEPTTPKQSVEVVNNKIRLTKETLTFATLG
ncbi:DUF1830 domain-containing protein [Allocoleopsis sp.]|uniref:DUF1830 domain-containing protein n=1 Tax=Allocoleopsis sp. TaxID=3088169 RepID=UPI002FD5DD46